MEHLEGRQSVIAALQARRRRLEVILLKHGLKPDKSQIILELAASVGVPVKQVDAQQLDQLTHGKSHGGVVAIASPLPRTSHEELIHLLTHLHQPALILLIEGVDDARNLGFVLRTAESMGAHAVLVKKHLWDFDPVEVARPASGAYERLPLVQFEEVHWLEDLQRRGLRLYGCVPNAQRTIYDVPLHEPAILAIGGEKRGLSSAIRQRCDRLIRIPTIGGPTSLSLSHAAAITLAEARRQRWTIESHQPPV